MFKGSMVALVTPMQADGSIDKTSLHNLVAWHLDAKTDAIVVIGTTAEAPTLTTDEQLDIITLVVKQVDGRIPVIAGTGTNSTASTITLTQRAKNAGVDACLIVSPYYNKPTQNGLYEHFKTVAETVDIPIILYNHPGRTGVDILPETVERLAQVKNIIGIKEATGKLERCTEIAKRCGKNFGIYSGEDELGCEMIFLGGHGVISVVANVAPREMHDMCAAALSGNKAAAEKINTTLMPLHKKLFIETNPIPTKWALNEMGLIPAGIRLPLLPLDAKFHNEVRTALKQAGITQTIKEL